MNEKIVEASLNRTEIAEDSTLTSSKPQLWYLKTEKSTNLIGNSTLDNFTVTTSQTTDVLETDTTVTSYDPMVAVTNCSMQNSTRVFFRANYHHTVYIFFGAMLALFFVVALVLVVVYLKHKRKVFRSRYGEYKLTTVRKTNSNSNENNEASEESVSRH